MSIYKDVFFIATIYYDLKEYRKAKEYMQKALRIGEKIYPDGHPYLDASKRWMELIEEKMREGEL